MQMPFRHELCQGASSLAAFSSCTLVSGDGSHVFVNVGHFIPNINTSLPLKKKTPPNTGNGYYDQIL